MHLRCVNYIFNQPFLLPLGEISPITCYFPKSNVAYDPLQNLLLNMSLSQELKKLTKRQLEILWRYYFAKESHEAIGKALNCAARTIGYQRVQALKKLKVNILL